ncbi:unnamed protein product, partial [Effrenium voratum]
AAPKGSQTGLVPTFAKKEEIYDACVHCHWRFTDDTIYCRHCGMRKLDTAVDWDAHAMQASPGPTEATETEVVASETPQAIDWDAQPSTLPAPDRGPERPKPKPPMPPPPKLAKVEKEAVEEAKVPWKVAPTPKPSPPKPKFPAKSKAPPKAPEATAPEAKAPPVPQAEEVPINVPVTDQDGRDLDVTVNKVMTVKELKAHVSKSTGVGEQDFRLVLILPDQRRILQDNTELLDAQLLHSADLVMEQPVEVNVVDMKGNQCTVKADRSWSFARLRKAISKEMDFSIDDKVLQLGRTQLPSSDEQLSAFFPTGPQQELLLTSPLNVIVSDDGGHRWVIVADRSWKIRKVQVKLMEESGYAVEEQTLQHAKLDPGKTVTLWVQIGFNLAALSRWRTACA